MTSPDGGPIASLPLVPLFMAYLSFLYRKQVQRLSSLRYATSPQLMHNSRALLHPTSPRTKKWRIFATAWHWYRGDPSYNMDGISAVKEGSE